MPWTPESDSMRESDGPETEAPVIEMEVSPEDVKPARRGRSPRASHKPAVTVQQAAPTEDTEAAPEPVRRRGRRKIVPEEPAVAPVVEAAPAPDTSPSVLPTRRRGRQRAAAEVTALTPAAIEPLAEENPVAETPSPKRGQRRGRPQANLPSTIHLPPLPSSEIEIPPRAETSEGASETTLVEEAQGKRGRNKRHTRRRRGQEDIALETVEMAEDLLPLPGRVETEEETEEIFFVPPVPPPTYIAPSLVPILQRRDSPDLLPLKTARLQKTSALHPPQIAVDDQSYAPYFFFINSDAGADNPAIESQIRRAAETGLHLFSDVMYLPLKNAYGERSFSAADAVIQRILSADPDALILPRLQFVPTNFWVRAHPDQLARYQDGSEGDVSLGSLEFWKDCVEALEALVSHFSQASTPGGDHVIGFHLDRGEWFYDAQSGPDLSLPNVIAFQHWLQAKYQAPYALRAAWFDSRAAFEAAQIPTEGVRDSRSESKKTLLPLYSGRREGRWVDYALFSSEIVAQIITGLAAAVKALSGGRYLAAVSYGYTMEFCTRNDSGHLALKTLLESPDIDIIAGPNSYKEREAGRTGAPSAPIDSVALHGKLWLVEDDTKTFLAESETPDPYNPLIASGADTQAAHQRHFGASLVHGTGVTWMDLWGQGWLDSPEVWEELRALRALPRMLDTVTEKAPQPDVAVLIDEASLAYFRNNPEGLSASLIMDTRSTLLKSGASIGFYLQSDITAPDFPDCSLYLFVNALRVTTEERQAIRERLQRRGKTLAWLYAPGMYDEKGIATQESSEIVGMTLRLQSWNARLGSQVTSVRHPLTEHLQSSKQIGRDETIYPSYAVSDPQATVLAEYTGNGAGSLAVREHKGGWKSVFIGDPHLSSELLRGLYAYAGVPVYSTQEDVFSARREILLIHGTSNGLKTIHLPVKATVYDVMEHKVIGVDTRSFRVQLRPSTTRLFLCGERTAIGTATGLTISPPSRSSAKTDSPFLPPPPDIPALLTAPLSEAAGEIAARYERAPSDEIQETKNLAFSDLAAVLDMDEVEEDSSSSQETATEEAPRSRSRWQRRRAAARARRDAERQTQSSTEGVPDAASVKMMPIDISALLPGLPPRRLPMQPEDPADEE